MKNIIKSGFLAGLALLLVACQPEVQNGDGVTQKLETSNWILAKIDGQPVSSSRPITLSIDLEKNRVSGFSGCNRYFSAIKSVSDNQLVLGPVAGTRMACKSADVSALEKTMHDSLKNAQQWEIVNGVLSVKSQTKTLSFVVGM